MKRTIKLFFSLLLLVGVLAGCSLSITKKEFVSNTKYAKTSLMAYAHGDKVFKEEINTTLDLTSLEADTSGMDPDLKAQMQKATKESKDLMISELKKEFSKYKNINGLDIKANYESSKVKIKVTVDYSKISDKDLSKISQTNINGLKSGKKQISLKKLTKDLNKEGFKEKK
ncbi:DUF1307 domain-containing protein [Companilactobacillus sp. DQM5]|uniref:DUF1307 domain-containing protein n=1 Tax=Companilactobacillus sp. DQM5 TaxID=3463359 RepID=UPI004059678E